ncbi:hypothetical protein LCGC14_0898060 [marine sediment metagenome]|uniref:B box-type domain-containing protein n=1 Tax=marine sediment metagenome TaxID=412755 RepID=A0A0F9PHZ1_9ZZZZ
MNARIKFSLVSASTHHCDNCSREHKAAALHGIANLFDRLEPGGTVPSGECPECGALCYPVETVQQRRKRRRRRQLAACDTCSEYCQSSAAVLICYACGETTCMDCSRLLLDHGYSHRYIRVCANCLEIWPERFGLTADDAPDSHFLLQFIPEQPTDLKEFRDELIEIGRKNGCT